MEFPPRNLPLESDDWGRDVENRLRSVRKKLFVSENRLDNVSRASEGGFSRSAQQLEALNLESTESFAIPDLQVSVSSSAPVSQSVTRTFPAEITPASGFLVFSTQVLTYGNVPYINPESVKVTMSSSGVLLASSDATFYYFFSTTPPEQQQDGRMFISMFARIDLPAFQSAPITVELSNNSGESGQISETSHSFLSLTRTRNVEYL